MFVRYKQGEKEASAWLFLFLLYGESGKTCLLVSCWKGQGSLRSAVAKKREAPDKNRRNYALRVKVLVQS